MNLIALAAATLLTACATTPGPQVFDAAPRAEPLVAGDAAPDFAFTDDSGEISEAYPHNPNGSPRGIAGLCSQDGRHLAMMPHPERTATLWQWGWMPRDWREGLNTSPWLKMFQNAREWCENV